MLRDHQVQAVADFAARMKMRSREVVRLYLEPPNLARADSVRAWNNELRIAQAAMGELWQMPCRSGKTRAALTSLYLWQHWLREWNIPALIRGDWAHPHLVLVPSDMVRDGPFPADWQEVVPPWDPMHEVWKPGGRPFAGLWAMPTLEPNELKVMLDLVLPGEVVVMTYHTLFHRQEIVTSRKWQVVVADEVHRLKNPRAEWTQAAYRLRSVARLGMSATPFTNYVHELVHVLEWLQGWTWGNRRLSHIWPEPSHWRDIYCDYSLVPPENGAVWRRVPAGATNETYLYHKLRAEVMFSASRDEVSEAPDPIIYPLPVPLSDKQMGLYQDLKRGVVTWMWENNLERFDAGPILARFTRLFQACAHAGLLGLSLTNSWTPDEVNGKLKAVRWVLGKADGKQVVILTGFSQMAEVLAMELRLSGFHVETLTGDTKDRQGVISRFKEGRTQIVICTKAAWEGISLRAPYAILYGFVDHTPGLVKQALLRTWNMEDTEPVQVYDIYAPDTVEEWNRNRIARKDNFSGMMTNGEEPPMFDAVAAMDGKFTP